MTATSCATAWEIWTTDHDGDRVSGRLQSTVGVLGVNISRLAPLGARRSNDTVERASRSETKDECR